MCCQVVEQSGWRHGEDYLVLDNCNYSDIVRVCVTDCHYYCPVEFRNQLVYLPEHDMYMCLEIQTV